MKVFQIVDGRCHWQTDFSSVEETIGRFPPDCLFVEAPDYVQEGWGFDETLTGEERFLTPEVDPGWFYDRYTNEVYHESQIPIFLEEAKAAKQAENNNMLAAYLSEHPLTWQDGKPYGVTMSDQNEIAMNLLSYQMSQAAGISNATLEWHSPKEACVPWTYENLTALSLSIRGYVYPWYQLNQAYKEIIYAKETKEEVEAVSIQYIAKADGTPVMPGEEYTPPEPKPFTPQPEQRYNMVYNPDEMVVSIWDSETQKVYELEEPYDPNATPGCAEIIQYGTEENPVLDENGSVQYDESGDVVTETREYFIMNDGVTKRYVRIPEPMPEPPQDRIPEGYKKVIEGRFVYVVPVEMENPVEYFEAEYIPAEYTEPDENGEVQVKEEESWAWNSSKGYADEIVNGMCVIYPTDKDIDPFNDVVVWDMSANRPPMDTVRVPDGYCPENYNTYIYGENYMFFPSPEIDTEFDPANVTFVNEVDEEGNETEARNPVAPEGYYIATDKNGSKVILKDGNSVDDLTYPPAAVPVQQ